MRNSYERQTLFFIIVRVCPPGAVCVSPSMARVGRRLPAGRAGRARSDAGIPPRSLGPRRQIASRNRSSQSS